MARLTLAERIARAVEARLGFPITVSLEGDGRRAALVLSGAVDSEAARRATEDIAARLAPGRLIENDLDVEPGVPDLSRWEAWEEVEAAVAAAAAVEGEFDLELDPEPDSADGGGTNGVEAGGGEAGEATDDAYFPPTDPVVTTDARGRLQVLGGFGATSMDSVEVEPSAGDARPGDEALADAIRRELREDALTTDLVVDVAVRRGVAHLRGTVPGVDDAENAEEVAARVPGVREVVEALSVADA
jgi:osmotically-inducible protein OsmY